MAFMIVTTLLFMILAIPGMTICALIEHKRDIGNILENVNRCVNLVHIIIMGLLR